MCRLIMYALLGYFSAVGPPHQNDQRADHGAFQATQEGGQATLRVEGQSLAQPAIIFICAYRSLNVRIQMRIVCDGDEFD